MYKFCLVYQSISCLDSVGKLDNVHVCRDDDILPVCVLSPVNGPIRRTPRLVTHTENTIFVITNFLPVGP